jgi:hypothetical protein
MSNEDLFAELIRETRKLVIVCDNAATVLSEEFESMIRGPLGVVEAVLDKCPDPARVGPWDGFLHDEDMQVEFFSHETHSEGPPRAVRVTHRPTEVAVESYSHHSREANEQAARRALTAMLVRRREAAKRSV